MQSEGSSFCLPSEVYAYGHHAHWFMTIVPSDRLPLRLLLLLLVTACAHRPGASATTTRTPIPSTASSSGRSSPTTSSARVSAGLFDTAWHASPTGATPVLRQITGVRSEPGPFRYYYRTPATTSLS